MRLQGLKARPRPASAAARSAATSLAKRLLAIWTFLSKAHNPDQDGAYIRPWLYFYEESRNWRAVLSLVDFLKWGAAVFAQHIS
jgi:hypothetical protein